MAGEIPVTVVGSITEPELRFLPNGKALCTFSLAHNNRVKVGDEWQDGEPTWFRVSVFGPMAENVVESFEKGSRVIVQGGQKTSAWEKDGVKNTRLEIVADEVGPSLRWATAKPVKVGQGGGGQARPATEGSGMTRTRTAPAADPWATPASNEPPF